MELPTVNCILPTSHLQQTFHCNRQLTTDNPQPTSFHTDNEHSINPQPIHRLLLALIGDKMNIHTARQKT